MEAENDTLRVIVEEQAAPIEEVPSRLDGLTARLWARTSATHRCRHRETAPTAGPPSGQRPTPPTSCWAKQRELPASRNPVPPSPGEFDRIAMHAPRNLH
jgi:hypothetical protein